MLRDRQGTKICTYMLQCFLTSLAFAVFQPVLYFRQQDRSEPLPVYKFWNQAFELMEEDSVLYIHSFAENVGTFVGKYEFSYKNIETKNSRNPGYSLEDAKKDFDSGKDVYFVGNANQFALNSEFEKVGRIFYFARNNEFLQLI